MSHRNRNKSHLANPTIRTEQTPGGFEPPDRWDGEPAESSQRDTRRHEQHGGYPVSREQEWGNWREQEFPQEYQQRYNQNYVQGPGFPRYAQDYAQRYGSNYNQGGYRGKYDSTYGPGVSGYPDRYRTSGYGLGASEYDQGEYTQGFGPNNWQSSGPGSYRSPQGESGSMGFQGGYGFGGSRGYRSDEYRSGTGQSGMEGQWYRGRADIRYGPYAQSESSPFRGWNNERSASKSSRRGNAPKGYERPDDRIKEDVCEAFMDAGIDGSEIEVNVAGGIVTMSGNVPNRDDRYHIEQLACEVSGVKDIENNIRVSQSKQGDTTGIAGAVNRGAGSGGGTARR